MSDPVIVCCAVTGGGDTVGKSPAVPVTPEQIASSSIEAAEAGAAIVHIHVRDPATGRPSMALALYREVVDRIRASGRDVLVNLTTGAGARFIPDAAEPARPAAGTTLTTPARRIEHVLALRPEICSLDMGTLNMGDFVFVNTPAHLAEMAAGVEGAGVLPELEVFEAGHVMLARAMLESGRLRSRPSLFQICLGVRWAMPATAEAMAFMRSLLPEGAVWFAFGVGPGQFPMVEAAVRLGGHVRVGLEDNLYLDRGVLAPGNGALVARAVDTVQGLGRRVATPAEARRLLGRAA